MIQNTIVIKGHLTGPRSVELAEAVTTSALDVEVLIRTSAANGQAKRVSDFLKLLPAGQRSKDEIDQYLREERESWGDR